MNREQAIAPSPAVVAGDATRTLSADKSMASDSDRAATGSALQQLLVDIQALSSSQGALDEARAKQLRKRYNHLVAQVTEGADGTESAQCELSTVTRALRDLREKINRQVRQRRERIQTVHLSLRECKQQLEQGHLKAALASERNIRKTMERIPGLPADAKKEMTSALEALQPELKQLKSTQSWSTNRAREMLIQQVLTLKKAELPPAEIARRIQQHRETWRNWDQTGEGASRRLWQQFSDACEEAYQPCKAHFEEQARQHKESLRAYQTLCTQLEEAASDTNDDIDWSDLDAIFRKSFAKKRTLMSQLRRKDSKEMEKRFSRAIDDLDKLLAPQRERHLKRREALIQKLRTLHEAGDAAKSVQAAKEAQSQWRPKVQCKQSVEKRLWLEFRTLCDDIFAQKKKEYQETRHGEKQNLKQREQLCAELRDIVAGDDESVLAKASEVRRIQESWSGLGPMPSRAKQNKNAKHIKSTNNAGDGVEKEFREALAGYQKRLRQIDLNRAATIDEILAERANICMRLEAGLYGKSDTHDKLIAQSQKKWEASEVHAGKSGASHDASLASLQQRFDATVQSLQGTPQQGTALCEQHRANLEGAQEICLHLEILSGVDSPPEFSKQRFQLQTQRLADAMAGKRDDDEAPKVFRSLCRRYWGHGGVPASDARKLEKRFQATRVAFMATATQ